MLKYKVIIKVGYNEAWFMFDTAEEACGFATTALKSMVDSEDQKKKNYIRMEVVDTSIQADEDDD